MQILYCPTNAHKVKKRIELLKHFKIKEAAVHTHLTGHTMQP